MRFAIVGEGLTDYIVIKNLLSGFFNDKNLPVTRLLPKDKEPVGWGNVFKYLNTEEFQKGVEFNDYCIVQIDTDKCDDWNEGITNICADLNHLNEFVIKIQNLLIQKIGTDFYEFLKNKIIFAISVHQIECWLLPFNTTMPAIQSKIVNCDSAIERIANRSNSSINQKYYDEGKIYDDLSKPMKKQRELLSKALLNPSLSLFVNKLQEIFPQTETPLG